MAGRDRNAERRQEQLAQQQQAQFNQLIGESQKRTATMDEYQKPLVDFYKQVISGDPTQIQRALSVPMTQLDKSFQGTKENIFENLGEGPARDLAMFQTIRDRNSQKGALQNQAFMQGMTGLSDIGTGQGGYGLQQLGAGSNFSQQATSTNNNLMQISAQRKAATLGALGQVASLGGSIATGGMSGMGGAAKASTPKGIPGQSSYMKQF